MKYIIICGPTGSGKSSLAMKLASRYECEIIGADSRQIYKHTSIGTAKPSIKDRRRVKHHLIDFLELPEKYSAFKFASDAGRLIKRISAMNRLPLVVGGTGLYLRALTEGIFEAPESDPEYRVELEETALKYGTAELHNMLLKIDPIAAEKLNPNEKHRLMRALEIFKLTGKSIINLQKSGVYTSVGDPLWLGVMPVRKTLYNNINKRVDQMLIDGFEQEVRELEPYLEHIIKRKMVGYTDMVEYLFKKTLTRDEAIEKVKQHHRNYAKRQITWFRKVENIRWFDPDESSYYEDILKQSDQFMETA